MIASEALYDRLLGLAEDDLLSLVGVLVAPAVRAQLPARPSKVEVAQMLVSVAATAPAVAARLERWLTEPVGDWLQWGTRRFGWVRLVGFQDRYKIRLPLHDIFVQLSVQSRGGGGLVDEAHGGERPSLHAEEPRQASLADILELSTSVPRSVGVVLLGDPGAGKTTLLHHLYTRVAIGGSESVGLPAGLFPVFIRCSSIRDEDRRHNGLRAVVTRQAEQDGYPQGARDVLGERRPILFLLDGLDEVRDKQTRARVCDWLGDEVDHWPGSRFVVTCRYTAFRDEARLDSRFLRAEVQWLDARRVSEFVHLWFRAVEEGLRTSERPADEAATKAEALLRVVLDPERQRSIRLREMTENPLLLSTLCLVHHSDLRLPEKRAELYDRCISLLLETWAEHGGRAKLDDESARIVLEPLAYAMHTRAVREVTKADAEAIIAGPLALVPSLPAPAAKFLEIACEQCGVLASRNLGTYEFFHLSFQEYLCAAYLKENNLAADLAGYADDPWWKEVIFLSMSMRGMFAPFVRGLIQRGRLVEHQDFVRECLDEVRLLDLAPFVEVLDKALEEMAAGQVTPDTVSAAYAVLALLAERSTPAISERAEKLLQHPDNEVVAAARSLLGLPVAEQVTDKPAAEGVWRAPVTGMSFVWVPPGTFWMGSSKTPGERGYEPDARDPETPGHEVELTRGYWMGEHPVTNAEYGVFLAETKRAEPPYWQNRRFNAPEQPVVTVSFDDALLFCDWLTKKHALQDGWCFDLPTEAEWEHAARGTDGRRYPWGNEAPSPERACFAPSEATAAVGGRPAGKSPFGCQDMAGNVWEWCRDAWRDSYGTPTAKDVDPCHQGDLRGAPRVIRGGSWLDHPRLLRCAVRDGFLPVDRSGFLGFRVVCRVSRQPWPIES